MDISPLVSELLKAHSVSAIRRRDYSHEQINGFLQEAYAINSRVSELINYLRSIRQPYLSTAPPPRRKQLQANGSASNQQYLTDQQRDQIDAESKSVLRDLHAAVTSLSQAEQNRQLAESALAEKRRRKHGIGALSSWAAGGTATGKSLEEESEDAKSNSIKAHRDGVIWYLQRRLEDCGSIQSAMMETRLMREMEKSKSMLYKAKGGGGPVPVWDEPTKVKAATTSRTKSSSVALEDELGQRNGEAGLSQEQQQMFQEENKNMLKLYEDKLDQVRTAEKSLLEISELQSTLAANLEIQSAHIDQLVQDSYQTTENVGSGNKELKRASERRNFARLVCLTTAGVCSFLVLYDIILG